MYAIVDIAGKQFKVEGNKKVYVPLLQNEVGSKVTFDQVLLVSNNDTITVGTPTVAKAIVEATVVAHVKGDKIHIFKYKRRKGFRRKQGHRQQFTQILIDSIKA